MPEETVAYEAYEDNVEESATPAGIIYNRKYLLYK